MDRICQIWNFTGIKWKDANWKTSECQIIPTTCKVWGTAPEMWKNANWNWSDCNPPIPVVTVVTAIRTGVDATTLIQPWLIEPWNPYKVKEIKDKKKKYINLICKVDGVTYDRKKEKKNLKLDVYKIKFNIQDSNINLDLKTWEE